MFLHIRINVERTKKSCATFVNSQPVSVNRKYLKFIIEEIHILAKQGIGFRGQDENEISSKILGNFKEFHKINRRHITYLNDNGDSKIAVYTYAKMKNE